MELQSIRPRKKRGLREVFFDENSANVHPSKKPRSSRTPFADRISDSRYVSVRSGGHPFAIASSTHSLNGFISLSLQIN